MTAATPISVFHQWLLADTASHECGCAIVLHGELSTPDDQLILEICDYLNEYDDESNGRWLPATRELVSKVTRDQNHRQLLLMEENLAPETDFEREYCETLNALGDRGHVVLGAPVGDCAITRSDKAFHVGLGSGRKIRNHCHIILNPQLIEAASIPHIIGDVFLGWLHTESLRKNPIHHLRRKL